MINSIKNYYSLLFLFLFVATTYAQKDSTHFVTTWKTNNNGTSNDSSILITTDPNFSYNYDIDWDNDGVFDSLGVTGNIVIQYDSIDNYTIRLRGEFPRISFGGDSNLTDAEKLISIDQWGNTAWKKMDSSFWKCRLMTYNATDIPNLDSLSSLSAMFADAELFNGYIGDWDVSSVTTMKDMFSGSASFNQNISRWDVSNVKFMGSMFSGASSFDQNLGNWELDSITYQNSDDHTLRGMFDNSGLSISNYDSTLIAWQNKTHPDSIILGAVGLEYCSADSARSELINDGWVFIGDTTITANCSLHAALTFCPVDILEGETTTFCFNDSVQLSVNSEIGSSYSWNIINDSTWKNVGDAGFSAASASNQSLVIDKGIAYVAYTDGANLSKTTVVKFDGTNWVTIGSAGFTAGSTSNNSLVVDEDTLYVAYRDEHNAHKTSVMKYDGISWTTVGSVAFSAGAAWDQSLVINQDTLYVAYRDVANSDKCTVMKFDGSNWVTVGGVGFSSGTASYQDLKVKDDTLYVAYKDGSNSDKSTVVKFDGTNWVTLGAAGFSAGEASDLSLAFDGSEAYLAYRDGSNSNKCTVKKFDGNNWVTIGTAGFSAQGAYSLSLAINNGSPYLAYRDLGNSVQSTVKKYDGNNWVDIGPAGFSAGQASHLSLAFNGNTPYLAYQDEGNSYKCTVMKFTTSDSIGKGDSVIINKAGEYEVVRLNSSNCISKDTIFITQNPIIIPKIVVGKNEMTASGLTGTAPYSYLWSNSADTSTISSLVSGTYTVTVTDKNGCSNFQEAQYCPIDIEQGDAISFCSVDSIRLSSGSGLGDNCSWGSILQNPIWENVGSAGFSTGSASGQSLVIYKGTPYVSFIDGANANKATVMKFDGSNWVTVGSAGFSAGTATNHTLVFNDSTPYLAYRDVGNSDKCTVMKFDGTNWVAVGTAGFTSGVAVSPSLAFDGITPYVAYGDANNSSKTTVMKFDGSNWVIVGQRAFTSGIAVYQSLVVDNGIPYVAFQDYDNSDKASVMKFDGSNWVMVGSAGFSAGDATQLSLAADHGKLYLAYQDYGYGSKTTVMTFLNGQWVPLGKEGFSSDYAYDQSLTIDQGTPYVAFLDGSQSQKTSVMKFDGCNWVNVGSAGISAAGASSQSIAVYQGIPYVAYEDFSNSFKCTVMKFPVLNLVANDNSIYINSTGEYQVVKTTSTGCVAKDTISVTQSPAVGINVTIDSMITCNGGTDGGATAIGVSGTAPYSFVWNNSETAPSITGLTSGSYTVTIRDSKGCIDDSTILFTDPAVLTTSIAESKCDSYTWPSNNITYTSTGVYKDTVVSSEGCDSIVTLSLTIIGSSTSSSVSATACDNYTWLENGKNYTVSGTYKDTLTNTVGCDSIITLNLTIKNSTSSTTFVSICDSYTWLQNGFTYSSTGVYKDTVTNAVSCDSIIILDLTIKELTSSSESITACDSYTWDQNGVDYTASGIFRDTIMNSAGCDSILTLNLTILGNTTTASVSATACDSYTWDQNGERYTVSGAYKDTITNTVGCDSIVTLNLIIKSSTNSSISVSACDNYSWSQNGENYSVSGLYKDTIVNTVGCDSVITLDLTIKRSTTSSESITACDSYTWDQNGISYTISGSFKDTIMNSAGCDSILTLNLTILGNTTTASVSATACDSYTWDQNGERYTVSGAYKDTITNTVGCDSIVTLSLIVKNSTNSSISVSACDNYSWSQNGENYTISGLYRDTISNTAGCDSIITLDLMIKESTSSAESITSCNSYTWIQNGINYTTTGLYKDTVTNIAGCDSIITLDLTINESTGSSESITTCDSYIWDQNGIAYTMNGIFKDTIINVAGCDSIITLNLTIKESTSSFASMTACDNYVWPQNGMNYSTSGTYLDTSVNAAGCDSIIALELTINSTNRDTLVIDTNPTFLWKGQNYYITGYVNDTLSNISGCDSIITLDLTITDTSIVRVGDSLFFSQSGSSQTTTYQWVDCDSGYAIIPGATNKGFKPKLSGNYAVIVTNGSVSDTSGCTRTIITGIKKVNAENSLRIYPNPTKNSFVLELDRPHKFESLKIYDLVGNLVKDVLINSARETVDVSSISEGVYMIKYGAKIEKLIIVK